MELLASLRSAEQKATVGLRDEHFAHAAWIGQNAPERLVFDRSGEPHKVTLFTNLSLEEVFIDSSPVKVGWLLEPAEVEPSSYHRASDLAFSQNFDIVLTHREDFLRASTKFVYMPFGGCWINRADWGVHPKSKNLSIIASFKTHLEGHRLRHDIVNRFGDHIDGLFGNAYQQLPLDGKILGLRDFRYSLIVENVRTNYFFTEKLIDAFMTGTVPIYWGCPDIQKFFNLDGMIVIENIDELEEILPKLGPGEYASRLPALHDNLQRAVRYAMPEDYLYRYILQHRYDT
jgi:hypothetical protein